MRTSVNMRDELLVRLNDIAKSVGYKSWRCMLTGIAKGEADVVSYRKSRYDGAGFIPVIDSNAIHIKADVFDVTPPDWNTPVA